VSEGRVWTGSTPGRGPARRGPGRLPRESATRAAGGAPMRRGVWVYLLLGVIAAIAHAAPPPRTVLPPPLGTRLQGPTHTVISPSGKYLAFVATGSLGVDRLWVRSITTASARKLAGTEGASFPFWSPDDRAIGFFAKGKLKTIATDGSATHVLC